MNNNPETKRIFRTPLKTLCKNNWASSQKQLIQNQRLSNQIIYLKTQNYSDKKIIRILEEKKVVELLKQLK